jgi:hypothetical protein
MAKYKVSPRKKLHKKISRRFGPLRTKNLEYAEIPGIELALFIAFPNRKSMYTLRSKRNIAWLGQIESIVSDTLFY